MGIGNLTGDIFYIDEVFAGVPDHKINGKQYYLWRAVDQDSEVVDVFLQAKRDGIAVTMRQQTLLERLLRSHGSGLKRMR